MKIAFDFDQTLTLMLETWLQWLNSKWGTNVSVDDCVYWDMDKMFPELTGYQIYEPLHLEEFWDNVQERPGMRELIEKLQGSGHEVYIATASKYSTLVNKFEKCLFKLFPTIKLSDIIITYHKELLQVDMLVDDNWDNLKDFQGIKVLVNMPYNLEVIGDYYLVSTADDIYRVIQIENE